MRLVLYVLLVVGCALIGRAISAGAGRRGAVLRETMDALMQLRIVMLEQRMPLEKALLHSGAEILRSAAKDVAVLGAAGAWQRAKADMCRRGGCMDCLTAEDVRALDKLFSRLGTGVTSEQEALFQSVMQELGRLEEEARRGRGEKGRLYTTLGMLFGLILVIVLI